MSKVTRQPGFPCPVCGAGETEFIALVPLVVKDKIVMPHEYAVCSSCYKKQWGDVYSEEFGMSFDEYVASQA